MSESGKPTGVLFICLGNICRSPLAEGIFTHLVEQRGLSDRFRIDSCGTGGWHAGNPPDPRSVLVASKNGLDLTRLRARKFDPQRDPIEFDWLIPMDRQNEIDIIELGTPADKVRLMRSFDRSLSKPSDVPDPYYGGDDGFDKVYEMLVRACEGMLTHLGH
ncbi:MAG: low molecular weight protein-tyrosine-phosphatase [Phycisphaerales bacterium]